MDSCVFAQPSQQKIILSSQTRCNLPINFTKYRSATRGAIALTDMDSMVQKKHWKARSPRKKHDADGYGLHSEAANERRGAEGVKSQATWPKIVRLFEGSVRMKRRLPITMQSSKPSLSLTMTSMMFYCAITIRAEFPKCTGSKPARAMFGRRH